MTSSNFTPRSYAIEVGGVLPFDGYRIVRRKIRVLRLGSGKYSDGHGGKWESLRAAAESAVSAHHRDPVQPDVYPSLAVTERCTWA